jgi:hypothetical protein
MKIVFVINKKVRRLQDDVKMEVRETACEDGTCMELH